MTSTFVIELTQKERDAGARCIMTCDNLATMESMWSRNGTRISLDEVHYREDIDRVGIIATFMTLAGMKVLIMTAQR